ncbi:MAG TPA: CBS domain-containing protein, partial [Burkholderiales bacterium]|nr:CBS domain-containing protein [Burkholderiales bacterium]
DDYVAEFVKGISRLKVLTAESAMRPIDQWECSVRREACHSVQPELPMRELISLMLESGLPVLIESEHKVIGYVDATSLLRTIQSDAGRA